MKLIIKFLPLLLLILTGCKEGKISEAKILYKIDYDGVANEINATDIFKDIHYLPLETNDSALLTDSPDRIICKNAYIYIADNIAARSVVCLFSDKGKYIRQIGKEGEGPEDHLGFLRMNVSKQGWVSVTDRSYSAIITYNTDGKFISRIPMDSVSLGDLTYLNDSLLLIKSFPDCSGHKFHVLNMFSRQITNTFYPAKKKMYQMFFLESLTTYKDKILMSEYQSNEVLELTSDSAKVRYIFNINDKMPPTGFWDQEVTSYATIKKEEIDKGYIGHIPCFAESDNSMLVSFRGSMDKDETQALALVDKSTGESQTFKRIMLADNVVIEPSFFYSRGDGKIIITLSPEEILNSGNKKFIAQFPGLKEESNPVLLFAELK